MFIKLRKNQIFYKQYFYIDLLERYKNDEYRLISNILQFGEELLYHITGFLYRYKKFRTHEEVVNYFINLYYPKNEFNLIKDIQFRRDSKYIKIICDLYK